MDKVKAAGGLMGVGILSTLAWAIAKIPGVDTALLTGLYVILAYLLVFCGVIGIALVLNAVGVIELGTRYDN